MSKHLWCCTGRITMEDVTLIRLIQRDDFSNNCTAVLYYQVLVLLFSTIRYLYCFSVLSGTCTVVLYYQVLVLLFCIIR